MSGIGKHYDVVVVGGGNAGLCAAISARRAGASVVVLEAASKFYRGGNTRHTRNMRCAHDAATDTLSGPYSEEEFFDDLLRVTGGNTNEDLARMMIHESKDMLDWIVQQGVRFVGTTLWSDFDALGPLAGQALPETPAAHALPGGYTAQLKARDKAFRAANWYLRKTGTTPAAA